MINNWFNNIKVAITNNGEDIDLNIMNMNCKISKLFVLLLISQFFFILSNEDNN